jgi:hypothetical protein
MSNSPDMVVAMLQHLDIASARKSLDSLVYRYTCDQIGHKEKLVEFFDNIERIQEKTIRQIPALFKKGMNE